MPTNIDPPALPDKPREGLLSVKDAANFLNISEGLLLRTGIPFVKVGRRRLYRPRDLDSFIERNLSHGGSRVAR